MLSLSAQELKIVVLRVAFQPDDSPATTGDGSFVMQDTVDLDCVQWTLDPPPHGRTYFEDHLSALDRYWQEVSNGAVQIDLDGSDVYPMMDDVVYQLPHDMLYYHPYLESFDETAKLFELSRHAIALADDDVEFDKYTTVILAHAGMGGDFAFALDPTPGNIPSAYLSQIDFEAYGTLQTNEGALHDLIIIPESQNFLQFQETRSLFEDSEDPCFYQVALNGTLALMLGFHLELPPLYNTETGVSLVGGFALMDQGSNNFHGIVPAYPDPLTRISKGWLHSSPGLIGDSITLTVDDPPVKIAISESEYYLIENRQRDLVTPEGWPIWIDENVGDTVSVLLSEGGVVIEVDEQHAGLPGNGLNIWHIDETAEHTSDNPNGGLIQMVDFVEADGAQDMGFTTEILFGGYLETGWWFDPWFAGNEGWFHLNRYEEIVGDSLLTFGASTNPATISNDNLPTHLRISDISKNGRSMSFRIGSDRLVEKGSISSIIGLGSEPGQVWAFNADSSEIVSTQFDAGKLEITSASNTLPEAILRADSDSTFQFSHPWVFPNLNSGSRFVHVESGDAHANPTVGQPTEIITHQNSVLSLSYFAENEGSFYLVKWYEELNQLTNAPLIGTPVARFQTSAGIQPFLSDHEDDPVPAGVLPYREPDEVTTSSPEAIDVISWSRGESSLKVTHLPGEEVSYLEADKPMYIIPLDVELDGYYEIALFYDHTVSIINQSGVHLDGSPFQVEAYFGNPVIGSTMDGLNSIFLRHAAHYSVHSLDGRLMDLGVLPSISGEVENHLQVAPGFSLISSGNDLLYFEHDPELTPVSIWSGPQGNLSGNRLVEPPAMERITTKAINPTSVYNYPNPVKGATTTLRAWVGDVDLWKVEIFSLSGARITQAEFVVEQPNSYHEWTWDTSDISNGLYVAQVSAGNSAEIIKIAIIR